MVNEQEYIKDFIGWSEVKQKLDISHKPPFFSEGQIWWCSVGVNIGYEICGKSKLFTRPILILRKYGRYTFLGIPMTSKRKDGIQHYPISFQGGNGSVILNQARSFDSKRLLNKMGELSERKLEEIREAFVEYNF